MDSVRFGRALGVGARAAAKTLVTAVDAATAPNPSAAKAAQKSGSPNGAAAPPPSAAATPSAAASRASAAAPPDSAGAPRPSARRVQSAQTSGARASQQAVRTATQARQTGQGLVRGSKRFGEAVWKPVVKLSGVLGLELAGVFFGLFAFFGAGWAWKLRGNLHETTTNHDAHARFLVCVAMTVVFGYFLVSSFVKANRRGRGR